MQAKIYKNLVTFPNVRRGNWHVKVSIFKDEQLMVVANHLLIECCVIKVFGSNDEAIDFINFIVEKDYYE